MSYVTHFSVEGLAGRSDVYAKELDRHVNVFFGLNGSGKTSLLRILDSAMTGDAASLVNVPFTTAVVGIYTEQHQCKLVRTIDKTSLLSRAAETPRTSTALTMTNWGSHTQEEPIPWATSPERQELQSKWKHTFLPISRMFTPPQNLFSWPQQTVSAVSLEEVLNTAFAQALKDTWSAYINGLLVSVRAAQSQGLANILKGVLAPKKGKPPTPALDTDVAYRNLRSFLERQGSPQILPSESTFKRRYVDDAALRDIVSDIDEVEKRIAAAFAPLGKLQALIGKMFSGGKSLLLDEKELQVQLAGEQKINLGQLSSGEKQVLRLLVEALRVEGSSLIVDEPELSMHVDWQRELVASMRSLNPEVQIIFATHSPEIMSEIPDSVIFRL